MVARRLPCLRLLAAAACVTARGLARGNEAIGGCTLAGNATHGAIVSDGAFCPDGYDFPRAPEQCAAAAVATGLFEAAAQEQDGGPADLEPGGGGVFCALVAAEAGCRTVFVPDGRCSDPEPDRVRALCLPCEDEGFSCEPGPKRVRTGRPLRCGPAAAPTASGAAAEDPAASAEPTGAGAKPDAAEGSEALLEVVAEDPAANAEPATADAEQAAEGSQADLEVAAEDPAANAEPGTAERSEIPLEAESVVDAENVAEAEPEDPSANAERGTAERSEVLLEAEVVADAEDVAEAEPQDPPASAEPSAAGRSKIDLEAETVAEAEDMAEAEPEDPPASAEPGTAERSEIPQEAESVVDAENVAEAEPEDPSANAEPGAAEGLEAEVVADAEDVAEAEPQDPPASTELSTAERSEILLEAEAVAEAENVAEAEPEDPPADAKPGTAERSEILVEAEAVAEAEVAAEAQPEDGSGSCAANASGEPGSNCSAAPGSANDSLEEKQLPPACARPDGWCSHPGAIYSERDCDVDGVLDPYCEENASGFSRGVFRGYISSAAYCLLNTWPVGGCNRTCPVPLGWCFATGDTFDLAEDCDGDGIPDPTCNSSQGSFYISSALGCQSFASKCGEKVKACPRPMWWCMGENARYEEKDCDRDGLPDPYCSQGSRTGYLSSANGCADSWPAGGCNGSCTVPEGWCNKPWEVYMELDCDGDGVPDPYCNSSQASVFLSSSVLCKPAADCLADLPPGSCKRPPLWCAGTTTYSREDCDFDGLPDPVCRQGEQSGFVSSADGCSNTWPNGGCNGTCLRPAGWCEASHGVYKNSDCDGDGLPDPTCHWANGTIGLVSSKQGCELRSPKGCSSGCRRPPDFCRATGERFLHEDIDFDGNSDAVCQSPDEDYPHALLSTFGCHEARVRGSRCVRFDNTCESLRPGGKVEFADCDGDGLEDMVCAGSGRTSPFYFSSAYSCVAVPFRYTCRTYWTPRHLLSLMQCPSVDGVCATPELFCNETTRGTRRHNFSMFDADGDGLEDPTCVWDGMLGLKRCAVVSSKYGCLHLWKTNCTNLTSDLADQCLPEGYVSRLEHRWYALQKSVGCSLRWMGNSVGKQGRVLGRIIATRAVASAGLLLCLFLLARHKLLARERLEPGSLGGETAGVWALRLASLPCRALAGAWACFGIFLDKELLRTCTFGSGLREALAMMEASWGAGVLQDASVLLPFSAGFVAAEFLLARCWAESFGAGAIMRTLHRLIQVAIWPQLQQRNRAVRYAMLQTAGELEEALEVCDWLLRRSRWSGHQPAKRLLSAARLLALLALRAAPGLAALRSLRLHPPYRHLWLADSAGEEAFPLAGPELVLLCLGCFLPPLLSLFRAGLGLAATARS